MQQAGTSVSIRRSAYNAGIDALPTAFSSREALANHFVLQSLHCHSAFFVSLSGLGNGLGPQCTSHTCTPADPCTRPRPRAVPRLVLRPYAGSASRLRRVRKSPSSLNRFCPLRLARGQSTADPDGTVPQSGLGRIHANLNMVDIAQVLPCF